jgi:hypothetical protein
MKAGFERCLHHRVRLRPPARRFRGMTELRIMDDDWLVQEVEGKSVRVRNIRTDQIAIFSFDQIRNYTPDPKREYDGMRHGFLELRVQVFLRGPDVVIEPHAAAVKPPAKKKRAAAPRKKS